MKTITNAQLKQIIVEHAIEGKHSNAKVRKVLGQYWQQMKSRKRHIAAFFSKSEFIGDAMSEISCARNDVVIAKHNLKEGITELLIA